MKAVLALENGSIYKGKSLGVDGEKSGWVSFYTGVVGYQEVMSNPANAGKIMVMTYPLIGNYGVAKKFMESNKCWVEAMIIKENSRITSNWQAKQDFDRFLRRNKVLAIEGVDTRTLMVELRDNAEQFGIVSTKDFNLKSLMKKIEQRRDRELNAISKASVKKIKKGTGRGFKIAVLDIGVTNSLLSQFKKLGCKIDLLPYNTSYDEIKKLAPKALVISDGPEMDKGIYEVAEGVKGLLGKLPIFGVGTGCQILAVAMGAGLKRIPVGHHGVNYPILGPESLKGEVTVQNHSLVIDERSLGDKGIEITWRNINDKTIEGIQNRRLKVFGCQFYPALPGMGEVNPVLKKFVKQIKK